MKCNYDFSIKDCEILSLSRSIRKITMKRLNIFFLQKINSITLPSDVIVIVSIIHAVARLRCSL